MLFIIFFIFMSIQVIFDIYAFIVFTGMVFSVERRLELQQKINKTLLSGNRPVERPQTNKRKHAKSIL